MSETKVCSCCKRELPKTSFYKNKCAKDGLSCYCAECSRIKSKESYEKHIEKRREKHKENYKKNREEYLERSKAWAMEHPEYFAKYRKAYSKAMSEVVKRHKDEFIEIFNSIKNEVVA